MTKRRKDTKPVRGSLPEFRIAGPDDPIYKGGLVITALRYYKPMPQPKKDSDRKGD